MEFKTVFEVKPRVKEVRTTVKIEKLGKVTKVFFPSEFKLTKGNKVVCVTDEHESPYLLKLVAGLPEKGAANYNVGDNSINSAPVAEKLLELFEIKEETSEFTYEIVETETHYGLKLTGVYLGKEGVAVSEESTEDSEEVKDEVEGVENQEAEESTESEDSTVESEEGSEFGEF